MFAQRGLRDSLAKFCADEKDQPLHSSRRKSMCLVPTLILSSLPSLLALFLVWSSWTCYGPCFARSSGLPVSLWFGLDCAALNRSVISDSWQPEGLQPARLLCPQGFSSKNTGVGCHALFQGIFPTKGWNPDLLHCRRILYWLSHQGRPEHLNTLLSFSQHNCK